MSYDSIKMSSVLSTSWVSIPLEQGNVLRPNVPSNISQYSFCLNPFGTGQCLTTVSRLDDNDYDASQSLWNRAMSYDLFMSIIKRIKKSQSLWNRAMSYDWKRWKFKRFWKVSIPLEQGNVLRHKRTLKKVVKEGLNPFGTGQCLTTYKRGVYCSSFSISLNPFGTGQCLTTDSE